MKPENYCWRTGGSFGIVRALLSVASSELHDVVSERKQETPTSLFMKIGMQINTAALVCAIAAATTGVLSAQESEVSSSQTAPSYGTSSIYDTATPSSTTRTTGPVSVSETPSDEDREPTTIASGGGVGTSASDLFDYSGIGGAGLDSGNFEGRPWGVSLSLTQGWDDNIYATKNNTQDSFFTSLSAGGYFGLSNGRTTLRLGGNLGGTYYWDRPGDSIDPNINATLSLSHSISPKWSLSVIGYVAYESEPNYQSVYGSSHPGQDYVYGSVQAQLSQRWSRRFSTIYGYTIGGVVYTGDADQGENSGRDRLEQTLSLQLRYLVQPVLTLVAEYRFGITTYNDDGYTLYNNLLAGFDYSLSQRLSASLRAGVEFRNNDDGGSDDGGIPFVEASLTYRFAKQSSLTWINRYGYEESNYGSVGDGRRTYRTGLIVNHQISSRIRAQLGGYYTTSDYDGDPGTEDTLDLNFNISYGILPYLSLQAGYTFTKVWSDLELNEYDRNRIYGGATFSF
ncbi:MAG TPA: outer membrane beta-barrel protein [Chthoniobacterales bacterium]